MENKVILITGANGGLGNSVTERFLATGAQVVGTSRKISDSDFPSSRFAGISAELSSSEAANALVGAVVARFGRIDALVHLVGGYGGGKLAETDDATFDKMLDMNLRAAFFLFRPVLQQMRKQNGGAVVAIGSRGAEGAAANAAAYGASKAALVSLVRTMAAENKDANITANAILPGTMDTPANRAAMPKADVSKWVQPASIAELIVWLTSDAGRAVNGAAIPVYGSDV